MPDSSPPSMPPVAEHTRTTTTSVTRVPPAPFALFVLLSLVLAAVVTSVHLLRWPGSTVFSGLDFYDFYFAGVAVRRGASPYDATLADALARQASVAVRPGSDFIYPPWFALAIAPLTVLSPRVAFAVWSVGLFVAYCATLWLLGARHRPWLAALLIGATPSVFCFFVGQINHYVLLAVALAWALRRTRPWASGALIGAAAAVKLAPFIVLLAMPRAQRGRAWAGALAALLVAAAVGLVALPGESTRWFTEVLPKTNALTADSAHFLNQGIAGFFARSLLENTWTRPWVALAPRSVATLSLLARLVFVAATCGFALFVTQRRPAHGWRAWSALVIASVLASPLAWEGTHVMIVFALMLSAGRVHRAITASVFVTYCAQRAIDLTIRSPSTAELVRTSTLVSSCATWACLLLLAAIVAPTLRRTPTHTNA